jgi:hypothetical protein
MIRRVKNKLRSGSVTMVLAPDDDGNWTERTEKLEIETALLQENERRFNQAKDTPFLVTLLALSTSAHMPMQSSMVHSSLLQARTHMQSSSFMS